MNPIVRAASILRKAPGYSYNMLMSALGTWPVFFPASASLRQTPVLCISLTTALRKRELMLRQARSLGLEQFEFVDAVDAKSLDRDALVRTQLLDDQSTMRYHGQTLTLREVACSLSHRLAYERVAAQGWTRALILEDDALFVSHRAARADLAALPSDADCCFLNTFLEQTPPRDPVRPGLYRDTSYSGSAAAYIVTSTGAEKLLAASAPVMHAADGLLGRCMKRLPPPSPGWRQEGAPITLTCYLCYPDIVLNGSVCHYHVSEVQEARK
jgi:glycosyl transferase family 25